MSAVTGLHHVTVIAGDPQQNLDFYAGVLGMRLVKRTVNQDVPGTYHLFYADGDAHPGTDLTFFPWPDLPAGRRGVGLTVEVALAVPPESLTYWVERLSRAGREPAAPTTRFGERVLTFFDPHGVALALVETGDAREFTPWAESPVPAEHQIRGLHGARLWQRSLDRTAQFLTAGLGFTADGVEDGWHRFVVGGGRSGQRVEVREMPQESQGTWGVGSVHHIAWRAPDDAAELRLRDQVVAAGRAATDVIDRFWFKSVYFREPGGALFEIATDGPGFAVDESPESLGESLVLPPWLEPERGAIEAVLPPLRVASERPV